MRFPGAEFRLVDDFSAGRRRVLEGLPLHGRHRFFEADILEADLHGLLAGADVVIHLAALTDPAESLKDPAMVDRVNLEGTARVAEACVAAGARMLFVSTTSVYGPAVGVVDETFPASDLQPENPYARSKLAAERVLSRLANEKGLRHQTCRFGTIFGPSPGMRFHTAINRFCQQASQGRPLTVWRTALHQRRPYLDLGDAMEALGLLIRRDAFDGNVYNVLTLSTTVSRVVEVLAMLVPGVCVEQVDSPVMSTGSYDVDGGKLARLGFVPRGTLEEGMRRTLDRLRSSPVGVPA